MSTPKPSLVKWVKKGTLHEKPIPAFENNYTPVILLADLAELVEGLRILSGIPGEYPAELLAEFKAVAYDPDDDECLSFSQWLSQRLLAQLEAHGKEGA